MRPRKKRKRRRDEMLLVGFDVLRGRVPRGEIVFRRNVSFGLAGLRGVEWGGVAWSEVGWGGVR